VKITRNSTREVAVGNSKIGNNNPILVQSMCATRTQDIDATIEQTNALHERKAGVVRIAVDNKQDAKAFLQENYRMAELVAPYVDKIRYNPGHLFHHERKKTWQEKVSYLANIAGENDCAMRVGVNCGSVDPAKLEQYDSRDSISPMLDSALEHCEYLDSIGFTRYCVSLKDSDPQKVITANIRFAEKRPDVPLHLGVTEAGMPPMGVVKTRIAFEQLISRGIGDTVRVSLTLPNKIKADEVDAGHEIIDDIYAGTI